MVFKVKKNILLLGIILLVNIVLYGVSLRNMENISGAKYAVVIVLFVLILLNIVSILINKIYITDNIIEVKSLYGKKTVAIDDLKEITFIPLRGRIMMMLTDSKNFAFVPSLIDGFDKIAELLKNKITDEVLLKSLSEIDMKIINSKNRMVLIFLIAFNVIIIASYMYNFIF